MTKNTRVANLRNYMNENNLDYVILSNFENQYYFTSLKAITYSRPILYILGKSNSTLIVPTLEENHVRHVSDVENILVYHEVPNKKGSYSFQELVRETIKELKSNSKIGIEKSSLNVNILDVLNENNHEVINVDNEIIKLRAIKSEDELQLIRKSGMLVSDAVSVSIENLKPGISELELDYYGNKFLFEEISSKFPDSTLDYFVMSPSGLKRTNMPHVFSNTRKIQEKDIIIHSRQVGLNGYRAECERTIFVGEPTNKQKEVFKVMVEAQQAAIDFIRVGVKAKEVNEVAVEVIKKHGFGEFIVHRTGHGIGIGVHEEPSLRFDNDLILEENMVFCVEPGIYIPDLGGYRHSDTMILKNSGTELVTDYKTDITDLTI